MLYFVYKKSFFIMRGYAFNLSLFLLAVHATLFLVLVLFEWTMMLCLPVSCSGHEPSLFCAVNFESRNSFMVSCSSVQFRRLLYKTLWQRCSYVYMVFFDYSQSCRHIILLVLFSVIFRIVNQKSKCLFQPNSIALSSLVD